MKGSSDGLFVSSKLSKRGTTFRRCPSSVGTAWGNSGKSSTSSRGQTHFRSVWRIWIGSESDFEATSHTTRCDEKLKRFEPSTPAEYPGSTFRSFKTCFRLLRSGSWAPSWMRQLGQNVKGSGNGLDPTR